MKRSLLWLIVLLLQLISFHFAVYPQVFKRIDLSHGENTLLTDRGFSLPINGRKRALLVGISYKNSNDRLNTRVDLERMISVLINRMGFNLNDIKIISDEQNLVINDNGIEKKLCLAGIRTPSCENPVINYLEKVETIKDLFNGFIIQQTNPGDSVLFYFSGHGMSIETTDKDEKDGCDEVLVTNIMDDKGKRLYISDNDINAWLQQLANKHPANVTVIFDSCFSGGTIRSNELKARRIPSQKGSRCPNTNGISEARNLPENFFFLSASQSNQLAYEFCDDCSVIRDNSSKSNNSKFDTKQKVSKEGLSGGVFTYYLTENLFKPTPEMTYQELIEKIDNNVSKEANQKPRLEFNQNQRLFGGTVPKKESIFTVRADSQNNIVLEAGRFFGMSKGSKFDIYPEGVLKPDQSRVIAKAVVLEVSDWKSLLKIDGNKIISERTPLVGIETAHNTDSVLRIAIAEKDKNRITDLAGGKELLKLISDGAGEIAETVSEESGDWNIKIRYPIDCSDDKNASTDLICQEEKGFRGVVLQRKDGSVIERIKESGTAAAEKEISLAQRVKRSLQKNSYFINFLSLFDSQFNDPGISVKIKMYDGGMAKTFNENGEAVRSCRNNIKGNEIIGNGTPQLVPNQCFWLEFENTGEKDVYISAFNQEANNHIKGVYPSFWKCEKSEINCTTVSIPLEEYPNLLFGKNNNSDSRRLLGPFKVGQVLGQERFYLIATTVNFETDLTDLINSWMIDENRAGSKRSINSPLGRLVTKMGNGKRSDNETIKVTDKWGTAIFSFWVVP